jgi:glycosyltransferase involved in cell wall biosynthesis
MSKESQKVSIVIPAFNEEVGLRTILPRLRRLAEVAEVIVVDDGSTDETSQVAKEAGARVLRQPYNKGCGAALKWGIREAVNDTIVIMDGDGQHNPDDLPRILEPLGEYDLVVGARMSDAGSPAMRRPGKRVLTWLAEYLSGRKIPDLTCGFRAFPRARAMEFLHLLPNGFSFMTTQTMANLSAGYSVTHVPIPPLPRLGGASSVSIVRDGIRTLLLITRIITLFNPLKVFGPAGLLLLLIGIVHACVGFFFFGHRISSGAVMAILGGIIILFFGILADQISVIVREGK